MFTRRSNYVSPLIEEFVIEADVQLMEGSKVSADTESLTEQGSFWGKKSSAGMDEPAPEEDNSSPW